MTENTYYDLHLAELFCDAILQVEDVQFPIHRIVLYDCSLYFQALFERWTNTDQVFYIPLVSPDMMRIIVEFAYTSFVELTENNVQQLMITADMLNIMGIVQACADFISERLCPQNCVGIWQFTDIFYNSRMRWKAFCYTVEHFEEVAHCKEILLLSLEELLEIIDKDELNVRFESSVFEAILRWIAHVPKERERHIAALISQVRLGLTSKVYIKTKVITHRLVKNNPQCKKIADNSIKIILHRSKHKTLTYGFRNTIARPRLPYSFMLAIGGWDVSAPICNIEAYDFPADIWLNIPDRMEHPRAYHGTVFLNGYIYCIGGFDRLTFFNSVERFDLVTHTWQEVAPMHNRRCYVSVTTLNGFIYAIGGSDGHIRHNNAERYCPETNQWTIVAPMNTQRSDASCTVLNNKIYICGGFSGTVYLQTAECYDPETDLWTMINPMTTRRRGLGVVAYNNQVYAVGGFDGVNRLSTVESYDPVTNNWQQLTSMMTCRSNFCLDTMQDHIIVVGGFDIASVTQAAELYIPQTDEWFEMSRSEISRSAASSCVVYGLPNMSDYIISRDSLPHVDVDEFSEDSE